MAEAPSCCSGLVSSPQPGGDSQTGHLRATSSLCAASRCRGRGDPSPGVPLKGSSASSTTSAPVPQRWATSRLFSRSFLELTQRQCSGPLTDLQVPSRLYATPFGSKAWNRALRTTITTCPSPPTCAGQSVTFYCVALSRMATARVMSSHVL